MQINFNTHNPNFTMAIKAEPLEKTKVANYLSKKIRNMTDTVELNKLIASQQTNTADIYLSTTAKSNNSNEKLCEKYTKLCEEYDRIGGYNYKIEYNKALKNISSDI